MRKKNTLWTMDKQGNLSFPLRERQLRDAYKPDSKWEHPVAAIIVMLVCGALDFVVFFQLFAAILYDQFWLRTLSVIGCIVAFDLAPIYLGILLKKNSQGMKINYFTVAALATSFIIVLVGNVWLRITVKDILVPSDSATATSIFGSVSTKQDSPALPYAIFSSALPFATSVVSFIVSYMSSNPLRDKIKELRTKQVELEKATGQIKAVLREYDEDPDLKARLSAEDDAMYESACALTRELGFLCADYVRERIKEHLGDAPATNELSKDCRDKLTELITAIESAQHKYNDTLDENKISNTAFTKEAA